MTLFCRLDEAENHRAALCALRRVGKQEVLAVNDEGLYAALGVLSIYQHKPLYTQDIFILTFCQKAHRQLSFSYKHVDNISFVSDNGITKS